MLLLAAFVQSRKQSSLSQANGRETKIWFLMAHAPMVPETLAASQALLQAVWFCLCSRKYNLKERLEGFFSHP